MNIRKLEAYDEFVTPHTNAAHHLISEIEEQTDKFTLEHVVQLAELCYKEGYKDGYRFADWLHEQTK